MDDSTAFAADDGATNAVGEQNCEWDESNATVTTWMKTRRAKVGRGKRAYGRQGRIAQEALTTAASDPSMLSFESPSGARYGKMCRQRRKNDGVHSTMTDDESSSFVSGANDNGMDHEEAAR